MTRWPTALWGRSGPNRLGNQWILGRQALFLEDEDGGSSIHINAGWYNAGGSDMTGYSLPSSSLRYLHMGLTDIAYYGYFGEHDNGAMVGDRISEDAEEADKRLWAVVGDVDGSLVEGAGIDITYDEYITRALTYYTYAKKRLRANPTPQGPNLQSWQIAQMHPIFLPNVSDFIVEFAADRTKDTSFTWIPEGDIDFYQTPVASSGNLIKWYVHSPFANWPDYYYTGLHDDDDYDPNRPETFPMIFPKEGASAVLESDPSYYDDTDDDKYPHVDGAFVWRHDDDSDNAAENLWPYLIRIRYRVHDPRGKFQEFNVSTGRAESGKWFEHVIAVKRPRGA